MSGHSLFIVILSLSALFFQCAAQQDCRYVTCGPPACPRPVNIPGRCCPVCPPAAGSSGPNAARCPRADITLPCGDHCATDMDCSGEQKCCDHGCGKSCREPVTVASGPCPKGQSKRSTKCEMLSGAPCGVGYYCKHSLASRSSECCPTPDYAGYNNNHPCATYMCTPLHCTQTYIPQGECCPACRPEVQVPATAAPPSNQYFMQSNQNVQQQQQQPQPVDPCSHVHCPAVNCMYPVLPPGQCCRVCQNAAPPPAPVTLAPLAPPPPMFTNAPSMMDSLKCMFSFCNDVTCPNSYIPTGECCHVCPPDPCLNAVCPPLTCSSTWKPEGQCCPICNVLPARDCYFKGKTYSSGRGFQNGCNNCTCTDGHVFCSNYTCEKPCHHNGHIYTTGMTIYSTKCQTCTCGNGVIFCTEDMCKVAPTAKSPPKLSTRPQPTDPCSGVACSKITCPVTYQPVGTCCPTCLKPGECLYEGKVYVNGAIKVRNCQKCSCMDGLMVCVNECSTTTTMRPKPTWRQPLQERKPTITYQPQPVRQQPTITYQPQPVRQQPPMMQQPQPVRQQPQMMQQSQPVRQQPQMMQQPQPVRQQPQMMQQSQPVRQQPQMMQRPQPVRQQPQMMQQSQPVRQQPQMMQQPQPVRQQSPVMQQTQPVRQPPPRPPPPPQQTTKASFKRGPPPRPPPASPTDTVQRAPKPPLLVQSSAELHVTVGPPQPAQTFQSQPRTYDPVPQTYQNPPQPAANQPPPYGTPQAQTNRPLDLQPYPDLQSTGNKPVRAEMYQTYPKVEVPNRRPIQTRPNPFEQLPPQLNVLTKGFPNMQPHAPTQTQYQSPMNNLNRPNSPPRYPTSQTGAGPLPQGQIISRNTGPKSPDEKCRMVNCPETNCSNYVIPRGECCSICKPKKQVPKKPGTCPPVRRVGLCVNFCKTDHECEGAEICCHNGCGTQCFPPVIKR